MATECPIIPPTDQTETKPYTDMKIHVPPKHEVKVMVGSSSPEHQVLVLVAMTKLLGRIWTDERSPDVQSKPSALAWEILVGRTNETALSSVLSD